MMEAIRMIVECASECWVIILFLVFMFFNYRRNVTKENEANENNG